jgi:hypothetical protein
MLPPQHGDQRKSTQASMGKDCLHNMSQPKKKKVEAVLAKVHKLLGKYKMDKDIRILLDHGNLILTRLGQS